MPSRLISIFGTYDFLGKSLPGMALTIGAMAFPPSGALPVPDISKNFLVLLSILTVVAITGTLIGEVVHSLADIFENVVGWILRAGWRFLRLILEYIPGDFGKVEPSSFLTDIANEEDDDPNAQGAVEDSEDSLGATVRVKSWLIRQLRSCQSWALTQIMKLAYVVWPHRKAFFKRIDVICDEDFRKHRSIHGSGFAEEYFIKEIVAGDYNVKDAEDAEEVYPVVVSTLSETDYNRAFRFQARYSFCRSMWLVLTLLSVAYFLTTVPAPALVPSTLITSKSFIAGVSDPVIRVGSAALFGASTIFAFASGSYKRHYIDYLIIEMFVSDRNGENKTGGGMGFRQGL